MIVKFVLLGYNFCVFVSMLKMERSEFRFSNMLCLEVDYGKK